jgi:hypothetical protein
MRSDARTASTPTTLVQKVAPPSATAGGKAHIVWADYAEEHEDAGDDVGAGETRNCTAFLCMTLK